MKLSKGDKVQLQSFLDGPHGDIVKRVLSWCINNWNRDPVIRDTEFETLSATFAREFKVKGVKELFEVLERLAYDDDTTIDIDEDNEDGN